MTFFKTLFILTVALVFAPIPDIRAAETLPAFPGAEGFGSKTPGGRGGRMLFVTNLKDDGPGSLRAAVRVKGPRIVVFRVAGTIRLKSHLRIEEPYLTVAGQTAPGGGILLRDAGLYVSTHDVVVRHLRVRIGASDVEPYDTQDCLHIGDGEGVHDVIADHLSLSWSIDEVGGATSRAHDITIQWCIFAEGLREPLKVGKDRKHAFCMMLGNFPNRVSAHHNLLANCEHRNPRIQGGTHEFVNNVVYNWGYFSGVFSRYPNVNFIGNYYKPGPESRLCLPIVDNAKDMGRIYVRGNRSVQRPNDELPEWERTVNAPADSHRVLTPFEAVPLRVTSAEDAYEKVLAKAGARLPKLDAVDQRILNDVKNKTGKIIDRPEEVGGYPVLEGGTPPPDSDMDGMPDQWEKACGMDPKDPADASRDRNGDGYTNIEDYLNELAVF